MRPNSLHTLWKNGGKAINGWLAIPSSFSAEIMAHQGWNSLTVDLQHGIVDYQTAVTMLQAISTTETVPMARVPWLEAGIIMKLLDAGAYGIICPMINTGEDAKALVDACRYAPLGKRSFGPARAVLYAGADYPSHANETVLAFAMIETAQALENLDAIMSTEGLDGVYIGPSDLGLSLGFVPTLEPTEPKVLEAIATILDTAKKHDRIAGIHCGSATFARARLDQGFDLITILSESRLMANAAKQAIEEVRGG